VAASLGRAMSVMSAWTDVSFGRRGADDVMRTADSTVLPTWDERQVPRESRLDEQPERDGNLVERIRSGDREALGTLYDRYAPIALATALRVVSDRAAAEDLVHDAFVTVWRKIVLFDPARGSIRSWLLTIVRNRAIDRTRAHRPSIEVGEADAQALLPTGPNPTWAAALVRLSSAQLRGAVASLPADQREAIELAYFGGHTYREIAVMTGVPEGTANGRLRLALAKLREALQLTDAAPLPVEAASSLEPDR
jgi:RNA polymerase sigma-70 factor, ECF subfamily